jgi:hypothetical protein
LLLGPLGVDEEHRKLGVGAAPRPHPFRYPLESNRLRVGRAFFLRFRVTDTQSR